MCSLHKQTDGQTSAFLFTSQVHQSMVSVAVLLALWICITLPIDNGGSRVVKVPGLTNDVMLSKYENSKKMVLTTFNLECCVILEYKPIIGL